ncbi:hypothetical protein MRX96_000540 [Rhipicephalus microplus]
MAAPPRSFNHNLSGRLLNSYSRNMIFHYYTYWCNREPERSVEYTSKAVANARCRVLRARPFHVSQHEHHRPIANQRYTNIREDNCRVLGAYGTPITKEQLLELVASVKLRFLSYIVDNRAVRAGCIVLRLSPCHSEFNLSELVGAKVKNVVAADNRDLKLSMVDAILRDKIKQLTAEEASKSIQDVINV